MSKSTLPDLKANNPIAIKMNLPTSRSSFVLWEKYCEYVEGIQVDFASLCQILGQEQIAVSEQDINNYFD